MKLELRKTADGSNTLYVPELDEHYHSFHGALQEAQHVFIKNGLLSQEKRSIRILEVGFGTGLNALLTACEAIRSNYTIDYVGIALVISWRCLCHFCCSRRWARDRAHAASQL